MENKVFIIHVPSRGRYIGGNTIRWKWVPKQEDAIGWVEMHEAVAFAGEIGISNYRIYPIIRKAPVKVEQDNNKK